MKKLAFTQENQGVENTPERSVKEASNNALELLVLQQLVSCKDKLSDSSGG